MENLLKETIQELAENGKCPTDVEWVGRGKHCGSWSDFAAIADFDYDAGYGGQEINSSLKIVGKDWWMERHEYDGSEWWEFKSLPVPPENQESLTKEAMLDAYYVGRR